MGDLTDDEAEYELLSAVLGPAVMTQAWMLWERVREVQLYYGKTWMNFRQYIHASLVRGLAADKMILEELEKEMRQGK